jgi:hypothetical protein
MNGRIPRNSLRAGDVLLYHGTGLISDLIRVFDGGPYSHASVYDGVGVLEALPQGTVVDPLNQSVSGALFVDVYRFISGDGTPLGQPGCETKPVLDRIGYYEQHHDRYGYEQILLLAVLCATRHPQPGTISPIEALMIRRFLDQAAEVIANLIHAGKEPMICSELVYRCYTEAGAPYEIIIRGSDVALRTAAAAGPPSPSELALQAEAVRFLNNYAIAKGHNVASQEFARASTPAAVVAAAAVADFVTPRDLETSPNLQKIGTLE